MDIFATLLITGLLAFAMESQDIAAVFREENATLASFGMI